MTDERFNGLMKELFLAVAPAANFVLASAEPRGDPFTPLTALYTALLLLLRELAELHGAEDILEQFVASRRGAK